MTLAAPATDLAESLWDWARDQGLLILVVIVGAVVVRWLLQRVIARIVDTALQRSAERLRSAGTAGRVIASATGLAHERHVQRTRTMGSLLRSTVSVVVGLVAVLTVMAILRIPLGPLLASAGVGGVALGFGAQSLVKDFLSGVFMILEDQYGVGDIINTGLETPTGQVTGTVEEVGLRVTRLRDAAGTTWYVRNGEIVRIGNLSQGTVVTLVDLSVAPREDLDHAEEVIAASLRGMAADGDWAGALGEEPGVLGVEAITATAATIRVRAVCAPGQDFAVQREIRRRAHQALVAAGVEGPLLQGLPRGGGVS
ncbi:MAG: mechanosensitive ion channel family protein [Micrococcales bacterium]|nr:mechanosensitive ion channel family protein [Micrococcales bacterium]